MRSAIPSRRATVGAAMGALVFQLLASTLAGRVALRGCPEACGNITVPYPFGIGQGCFRTGFNLTCDKTHHPPKLLLVGHNVEVFGISLSDGTVRIHSRVLNASSLQYSGSWSAGLMGASPFVVSTTYNMFVAIGCNLLARLVANHDSFTPGKFVSICAAVCLNGNPVSMYNASCTGVACCQMSISQGSSSYGVQMKDLDQADGTGYGAAFIVEEAEWFSRQDSMVKRILSLVSPANYYYETGDDDNVTTLIVPTVLEWFLDSRDSEMFIFDPEISGSRCISFNSSAVSSVSAGSNQLRCDCLDGFQGNPYIINGCQGTDRILSISSL